MKRRIIEKVVFVFVLMCIGIYSCSVSAKAATYNSSDGKWQYVITSEQNKTVEIVAAYASAVNNKAVSIPGTIDGYRVSGIGENVFKGNRTITSVTFGIGIEYIGDFCFRGCNYLKSVTLPNTLNKIGGDAFNSCSSLSSITIPETVNEIGGGAFWYTQWLNSARNERDDHLVIRNGILIDGRMATGDVSIPDTVTSIANCAFYGPDSVLEEPTSSASIRGADLQSVTIPASVKTIGELAFYYCINLKTIRMEEGVTTLKREAFSHCTSLADVTIPSTLQEFGAGAFWYTSWLEKMRSASTDKLIIINNILIDGRMATGDVVIPQGVCMISPTSFYAPDTINTSTLSGSSMTSLKIPDSVKEIGFRAFTECVQLKQVVLPSELLALGANCFNGCTSLQEIIVPDTIQNLEKGTFENCTDLKKIVLSTNMKTIDETAIPDNKGLVIVIPEDLTDIRSLNLLHFENVFLYVVEGGLVEEYLKQNQFTNSTTFKSSKSDSQPSSSDNNENADNRNEQTTDVEKKPDQEIVDPLATTNNEKNNVVEEQYKIGKVCTVNGNKYKILAGKKVAFIGVIKSTQKSLSIPSSVKLGGVSYKVAKIGDGACKGMKKLEKVTISNSVLTIGNQAFMNCGKLCKVQIGTKVTSIGSKAFYGDKKLKAIIIKSKKVKKLGKKAFNGISKAATFRVPKGKGNTYKKMIKKAR